MVVVNLPGTQIPIHCFKCRTELNPKDIIPNPFPTPIENREEWFAFSFTCRMCGTQGTYQYRVKEQGPEE